MSQHKVQRTCGQEDVTVRVLSPEGHRMIRDLIENDKPLGGVENWARRLSWHVEEVVLDECPAIDLEVDVVFQRTWMRGGIEWWTCPVCGFEHEEEIDGDED